MGTGQGVLESQDRTPDHSGCTVGLGESSLWDVGESESRTAHPSTLHLKGSQDQSGGQKRRFWPATGHFSKLEGAPLDSHPSPHRDHNL